MSVKKSLEKQIQELQEQVRVITLQLYVNTLHDQFTSSNYSPEQISALEAFLESKGVPIADEEEKPQIIMPGTAIIT